MDLENIRISRYEGSTEYCKEDEFDCSESALSKWYKYQNEETEYEPFIDSLSDEEYKYLENHNHI
jgi:hypothetical protein